MRAKLGRLQPASIHLNMIIPRRVKMLATDGCCADDACGQDNPPHPPIKILEPEYFVKIGLTDAAQLAIEDDFL